MKKMVYKIMVEFKLIPAQPISGKSFEAELTLTNIGDSVFPGGELTKFAVRMPTGSQELRKSWLPKIPSIKANKSIKLKPQKFHPIEGGIAWIEVQLKPSDGEKVNLFQNPEYNFGVEWTNNFRIKRQEDETMINLLKRIVELLEKREK